MFGFLKDKLKQAVSAVSEKIKSQDDSLEKPIAREEPRKRIFLKN